MSNRGPWQRVSRRRPCPVCRKPDWCMVAGPTDAPTAAICARVESPKRAGAGGWLHALRDDGPTWAPWRRTIPAAVGMMQPTAGKIDFGNLAADCIAALQPEALNKLAAALGLSPESLRRLAVGWSAHHRAWTFPMRDAAGNVLGIRLRLPSGKKISVKGGREGLFIPEALDCRERLMITEGPTDCAALLDLGFAAVGRPSCMGGVRLLVDLCRQRAIFWEMPATRDKPSEGARAAEVVIVADGDPPGQRGAEDLAATLVAYCTAVRVIAPPAGVKDARAWLHAGATHDDVHAAIAAAPVRTLPIHVQTKGRRWKAKAV